MKRLLILSTTFFLVLGSTNLYSQKRDSRDLLPEGSFPQGMEGPAVDRLGNLYAVNYQKKGTIGKVSFAGKVSLFVTLPEGSTGNGIRFDRKGNMFVADYTAHNILKINRKTKEIEVFAHEPAMNQPNDLTISRKTDIIYASDPNWKDSTGNLWMIKPDGKVVNLERNIGTTNGIEVSPNGKYLYVNESIQRKIWRYDIAKDGSISNKTLFYSFEDFGMDGMRCDSYGNLFVTRHGKGTVVKLSPKGKLVKEYILKGKLATNLTFSQDESMIYVTVADRGCFETIYLGENPTFSSSHTTK
ncbi:MAG: SMP-30/gluconolactonase/LRE family protein [Bacteroidales bacterium]